MVETLRVDGFRQLHRMARAFHVGFVLTVCIGCQVVNGCQVEEMLNLTSQLLTLRWAHPAKGPGDITSDGHQFCACISQARFEHIEFFLGTTPDQHIDRSTEKPLPTCKKEPGGNLFASENIE